MSYHHAHVRPANACPASKCMSYQHLHMSSMHVSDQHLHEWSVGDMGRPDRGGLSQDSQKQLQQEPVLAHAGISHSSHKLGVLLHFEYFCNLNIIKYPDSRGYQMYDPKPINIWLMGLERGLLLLLGNFGSEFSRERKCWYHKEFLYFCNLY